MAENEIKRVESTVSYKGKSYRYFDMGTGDVSIVLVHGLLNSAEMLIYAGEILSKKYRVIIPEIPGHMGMSLFNIDSLESLAEYYRQLLEILEIQNYFMTGYSLGGLISLKFAEKYEHGNGLRGVVCWASPLIGMSKNVKALAGWAKRIPENIFNAVLEPVQLLKLTRSIGKHLPRNEMIAISKMNKIAVNRLLGWIEHASFQTIPYTPKLFIYGTDDNIVPSADAKTVVEEFGSSSELVVIESGGHGGTREGHLAAVAKLSDFVERHSKIR